MSKTLSKFTFPGEFKTVQKSVKILGKTVRVVSKLFEISGASTKTSKEIDEDVIIATGELSPEELNGLLISDPTNHYLLVRQEGKWNSIAIGDSGWITPTLINSYTSHPGYTVQYRKIGNVVRMRGSFTNSGTLGSAAFVFEEGFRPIQEEIYTLNSYPPSLCSFICFTNGNAAAEGSALPEYGSLSGLTFTVD